MFVEYKAYSVKGFCIVHSSLVVGPKFKRTKHSIVYVGSKFLRSFFFESNERMNIFHCMICKQSLF